MPTRTELNSVHKRMHDLRRELRGSRGADANGEIAALRAEVQKLREQLNARQAKPAQAAPAKSKGQVAPTRKRAAAVAKPRSASKQGASNFAEALNAMKKSKPGSRP